MMEQDKENQEHQVLTWKKERKKFYSCKQLLELDLVLIISFSVWLLWVM